MFTGNSGYVAENPALHQTFMDLSKQYGPIVGLQLGWYPTVVISDYQLVKKALDNNPEIFSNRPNHIVLYKIVGLDSGTFSANAMHALILKDHHNGNMLGSKWVRVGYS